MRPFSELPFFAPFVDTLPGEPLPRSGSRLTLGVLHSPTPPEPVRAPQLLAWSESAAQLLELANPTPEQHDTYAQILSGNRLLPGMRPYATRYGGHQFGHWAGQLGDGRAIILGEVPTSTGACFEVQLKGAGRTPYSRRGDGRAVLRSSLREFLCSEAMHHLRVPTTRALALVGTGEQVVRDLLYDGNPRFEPGAIVTRVAPSFLRLGHYELLAKQEEVALLRQLVEYTLNRFFPNLADLPLEESVPAWFTEVAERTARLMVDWLRIGFVHGVMNTDNLSVLGLTIDYGPYGWLDAYTPEWTPNTTDSALGRYRYSHQPSVALWNLTRFAEALAPLLCDPRVLQTGLERYRDVFHSSLRSMIAAKLGLSSLRDDERDGQLLADLETLLTNGEIDFTIFYRKLADWVEAPRPAAEHFAEAFYGPPPTLQLEGWLKRYRLRAEEEGEPGEVRAARMRAHTPYFILRNYLVYEAIQALEKGDRAPLDRLWKALQTPYEETAHTRPFFQKRPEWARHLSGASALSCSS